MHLQKLMIISLFGKRGNSSVGRARPCQGRGRGSESRFPLKIPIRIIGSGFFLETIARVVELVDTLDLKSNGHRARAGSSPASSTGKPALTSRLFLYICMWFRFIFLNIKHC